MPERTVAPSHRWILALVGGGVALVGSLTNLALAYLVGSEFEWTNDLQNLFPVILPVLDAIVILAFVRASLVLGWHASRAFWVTAGMAMLGGWLAGDLIPAIANWRGVDATPVIRVMPWLAVVLCWLFGLVVSSRRPGVLAPVVWVLQRRSVPMYLAAAALAVRIGLMTYWLPVGETLSSPIQSPTRRGVPPEISTLLNPFESPQACVELRSVGDNWDAVQQIVVGAIANRTSERAADLMRATPQLICESVDWQTAERVLADLKLAGADAIASDVLDHFVRIVATDELSPIGRPSQVLDDAFLRSGHDAIAELRLAIGQEASQSTVDRDLAKRAFVAYSTAQGRVLYQVHCSPCHAATGSGDGVAAAGFGLRPADFRDPAKIVQLTPGEILWRIEQGAASLTNPGQRGQSAMPAWKDELDRELVWKIVLGLRNIANQQPAGAERQTGQAARKRRDGRNLPDPSWTAWPVPQRTGTTIDRSPESTVRGAYVYYSRCMPCHGLDGRGDGPAADSMWPRPRDFTTANFSIETRQPKFKFRTTRQGWLPSDADLFRTISRGLTGTAMEGWTGVLSADDIWQVIDYLKTLSPAWHDPEHWAFNRNDAVAVRQFMESDGLSPDIDYGSLNPPRPTERLIQAGADAYRRFGCTECHGFRERGDGPALGQHYDDWGYRMWPPSLASPFHFKAGDSVLDIYRSIAHRLDGSAMPVYGPDTLDRTDLKHGTELQWAIATFVNSQARQSVSARRSRSAVLAARLSGRLPTDPLDHEWNKVPTNVIPLSGQVVAPLRWAAQSVSEIRVRAAVNDNEISLWLQWDDRRPNIAHREVESEVAAASDRSFSPVTYDSPAGKPRAPVIFDARDQVEIQFPDWEVPKAANPPFFYGSPADPVLVWRWVADRQGMKVAKEVLEYSGVKTERTVCVAGSDGAGAVEWLRARGPDETMEPVFSIDAGRSRADWSDGVWTLVMSGPALWVNSAQRWQTLPPLSIRVWDGLAGESGRRLAMSSWVELVLPATRPYWHHVLAGCISLAIAAAILWLAHREAVKKQSNATRM